MMNYRFAHTTAGEESYSSAFEAPRSRYRSAGVDDGFGFSIAGAVRAVQRWYRYRRTAAELNRLDDRMLRDIGLNRDEIGHVARGLAARYRSYP